MKTRILMTVFCTVAASASFADDSMPERCEKIFPIAASLVENKEKGLSEADLRAPLPPLSAADDSTDSDATFMLKQMHEMVSEVFSGDTPSGLVYAVYRAEKCVRESKGLKTPESFKEIRPKLVECTAGPEDQSIECAMMAAGSHPDDPE